MGRPVKNLQGRKFGRLTVLEQVNISNSGSAIWLCQCECGNIKRILSPSLLKGVTRSCGCLQLEYATSSKHAEDVSKHGKSKTKIYNIFRNLRYAHNDELCDQWKDKENGFMNFYNWAIENGYDAAETKKQYLCKKDNTIKYSYSPENCFWSYKPKRSINSKANS